MERDCGIPLQVNHYGCMSNLFSWGGYPKEGSKLLYTMPILKNLLDSFLTSYPTLKFPRLPENVNFYLRLLKAGMEGVSSYCCDTW